jgi:hypothetical protein
VGWTAVIAGRRRARTQVAQRRAFVGLGGGLSREAPRSHVGRATTGSRWAGRRQARVGQGLLGKTGVDYCVLTAVDLIRRGRGGRLTLVLR